MMALQHGVYAGWDYALPLTQNSDWTTVTIDSYAGKDAFDILLLISRCSYLEKR
jgi:hypothetical protein